jgi:hypothetical protein
MGRFTLDKSVQVAVKNAAETCTLSYNFSAHLFCLPQNT